MQLDAYMVLFSSMTGIDFDREGFPHERRYPAGYQVPEEDRYVRKTLLPLMRSISDAGRSSFDDLIIGSYAPEAEDRSHRTAMLVISKLPMSELVEIAESAEYWAANNK